MSARNEFSAKVALEIKCRSKDANGIFRCEKCFGVAIRGEIHHINQDAMQIDKARKLTAKNGQYLCRPCHKEITAQQAPVLAKVKRMERRNAGVRTVPVRKIESAPGPISERTAAKIERGPKAEVPGATNIMRRYRSV